MSEHEPISDQQLDTWGCISSDHVHGRAILRLVAEVRWLRSRVAWHEAQTAGVAADARDWHWECVQDVAARLLAGMAANPSKTEDHDPIRVAVDTAEALVAEVARRRGKEAGDG